MVDNETEAFEFLERLDLEPEDFETKTILANKLDKIFQTEKTTFASRDQTEAIFNAGSQKFLDFPSVGIVRREVKFRTGTQIRFTIPNQRGLFGFTKALNFFKLIK